MHTTHHWVFLCSLFDLAYHLDYVSYCVCWMLIFAITVAYVSLFWAHKSKGLSIDLLVCVINQNSCKNLNMLWFYKLDLKFVKAFEICFPKMHLSLCVVWKRKLKTEKVRKVERKKMYLQKVKRQGRTWDLLASHSLNTNAITNCTIGIFLSITLYFYSLYNVLIFFA